MELTEKETSKFRRRIEDLTTIDEENGCWLWKRKLTPTGYGRLKFRGQMHHVQRLAYAIFVEHFPSELCILHHCDVRHCCNPNHLFLGDRILNALDRDLKGRTIKGENHPMFGRTGALNPNFEGKNSAKGEKHWLFKRGNLISGSANPNFGKRHPGLHSNRKRDVAGKWVKKGDLGAN